MKLETFFEKFDQFADAPDAVAKMRELVLRLAMQGKLVSQNPRDKPADSLVVELKAEVGDKNSRRTAPLPPIAPDEIPFELPAGWVWERLGNIGETNIGLTYSPQDVSDVGTPVLRSSNVQNGKLDFDDLVRVTCEPKQSVMVRDGDLLICARNGSRALVGKVALIENLKEPAAFGAFMAIFRSRMNRFLYHFICSPLFRRMIDEVNTTTINQITQNNLRSTLAPIPPLAEQKRIVAKVDELMALCDRLALQQQERETRHALLARASLARFADAPTPANLNFLFHSSFTIHPSSLRKSILTLAVQGKLVPQDPNDEPAEAMVGRNEELNADASFEIPDQWTWTQLSQLADINGGFAFKSTAYTDEGTRVVRISDFDEFGFKDHKVVRHPFTPDLQKFTLAESNILMAMTGGTVGKSYFVRSLPEPMVVNQRVATIKVSANANPSYVDIAIRSEMTQEVIRKAKNSTNDNISMGDIKGFAIPLPPLAEQRRIVAKVEQLMALVDALETQLAASRATAANLLSALVAELTAA